jgi:hypothetical protein
MTARRTFLVALAAALAAAAVYLAFARWAAGDLAAIIWEGHRREAMDERLTVSRHVVEEKSWVVHELIAGRMTLREAACRFRELNATIKGDPNNDRLAPYRVVSGEEGLWRNVYFWAEVELYHRGDPDADAVRARLSAEYRARFGHDPEPFPKASLRPDPFWETPTYPPPAETPLPPRGEAWGAPSCPAPRG